MVDQAPLGIRRDDQSGNPQAITVLVDRRGDDAVVEAAPVVPAHEDGRGLPVRALHGRVDDRGDIGLPSVHAGRRVLAVGARWHEPAHRWQRACLGGTEVRAERLHVAQLVVLPHVAEERERVPDSRRPGVLRDHGAGFVPVVGAVRRRAWLHVIPPAHVPGRQQPGDVGPGQVDRRLAGGQLTAQGKAELPYRVGSADVVVAAHGRVAGALRRPAGDHVQVIGQRP